MHNKLQYLIDNNILSEDSVRLFYTFDNYQTGAIKNEKTGVFDGEIDAKLDGSTDFGSLTLSTGTLGEFKMFGGVSGYTQTVSIQNSQQLINTDEFSIILEGEILTKPDFLGTGRSPIHNKEIILSSLNPTGGFELGINGANRFYLKSIFAEKYKTISFDKVPFGKNIWAARYVNEVADITRFIPEEESLDKIYAMSCPIEFTGNYLIGTGLNSNVESLNTGISSYISSSLKLNNLLIVNEYLHNNSILEIAKIIKSSVDSQVNILSSGIQYDYDSPVYSDEGCINVTGITGYLNQSGTISQTGTITTQILIPISGQVLSGESYKTGFCDLTQTIINLGAEQTLVVGYSPSISTEDVVTSQTIYTQVPQSGIIDTMCSSGISYTGSNVIVYTTGLFVDSQTFTDLFPKSMSYVGDRYEEDFVEILTGASSYSSLNLMINESLQKLDSSYYPEQALFASYYNEQLQSGICFYLNGLLQRYGSITLQTTYSDGFESEEVVLDKDYSITGINEIITSLRFDGDESGENLWGVLDRNQSPAQERQEATITGYYSGVLNSIDPTDNWVFLNGVKLYENLDYTNNTGQMVYLSSMTGITGIVSTVPKNGTIYSTGTGIISSFYGSEKFEPKSNIIFINGLRIGYQNIIEHDYNKDLISEKSVIIEGTGLFEGQVTV
jgi:hypothetical protein